MEPAPFPSPLPPPPTPPPPAPSGPFLPQTAPKAVASLVLGILCLVGTFSWFGLGLGVPAVLFGAFALRDIRRMRGMLGGHALASAGIAMGTLGTMLFCAWVALLTLAVLSGPSPRTPFVTMPLVDPPVLTPSRSRGRRPKEWERIPTVELHASGGPLRGQLAEQAKSAKSAGETVLVETSVDGCDACDEIAEAMGDPLVKAALSKARLIVVDAEELQAELAKMHMSESSAPWFYLIGTSGEPWDAISADEWDENEASEIAPVLGAFVRGRLTQRRVPWRGVTSL